jgi:hypothetical protein
VAVLTFPVSVKGVVLDAADRVLLLKNERDDRASELDGLTIPDGYRRSIAAWLNGGRAGSGGPRAPGPGRSASRPGR